MFDFFKPPDPPVPESAPTSDVQEAPSPTPVTTIGVTADPADENTLATGTSSTQAEAIEDDASRDSGAPERSVEAPEPPPAAAEPKTSVQDEAAADRVDPVDLPDFSHEPTEPGQYTLRVVFTFRPGDQTVLVATQSHDVLPLVSELDPAGARALLAPFIAAHDARLSEIKQALTQPAAKDSVRRATARSTATQKPSSTSATATKASAAKKDKPTKVVKPATPTPLPQTNLFND